MAGKRIVAVGLLTESDLQALGTGFKRSYPLPDDGDFSALLRAIDLADVRRRGH